MGGMYSLYLYVITKKKKKYFPSFHCTVREYWHFLPRKSEEGLLFDNFLREFLWTRLGNGRDFRSFEVNLSSCFLLTVLLMMLKSEVSSKENRHAVLVLYSE